MEPLLSKAVYVTTYWYYVYMHLQMEIVKFVLLVDGNRKRGLGSREPTTSAHMHQFVTSARSLKHHSYYNQVPNMQF